MYTSSFLFMNKSQKLFSESMSGDTCIHYMFSQISFFYLLYTFYLIDILFILMFFSLPFSACTRFHTSCSETAGSRNLSGNRDDFYDELDFLLDGRGRPIQENPYEDDFVMTHRRFKERAAAAFEDDMAELRRKRRDMQDRIFDVIDLNAEIEKAKNTLQAADIVFQRHATKFNNQDDDEQTMSLSQKLDRTRKIANIELEKQKPKTYLLKWPNMPVNEPETVQPPVPAGRQRRINSLIDTNEIGDPLETLAMQPMKRRFLKRKKSVSF